jgi:hypothetical protein
MAGCLLKAEATVICMHGSQARALVPNLRVNLSAQPTAHQPTPWIVTGFPPNVSGAPVPCVTARWRSAATWVRSNGLPLLLDDGLAVCAPNGSSVNVVATEQRVQAI